MPTTTPVPTNINLRIIRYSGDSQQIPNILFLGDGFAQSDQQFFIDSIKNIMDRFFKISPFHLVQNKFNVYYAFTPSPSSGISVAGNIKVRKFIEPLSGAEIIDYALGYPASAEGEEGFQIFQMVEKQSALGLTYVPSGDKLDVKPKSLDQDLIPNLIRSLPQPHDSPMPVIPGCWDDGGKDFGLVCVLVNDNYQEAYSNGRYIVKSITSGTALRNLQPIPNDPAKVDHFPENRWVDYGEIAAIIAHEFGHSYFKLGDEYINYNHPKDFARAVSFRNILSKDLIDNFNDLTPKWLNTPIFSDSPFQLVTPEVKSYMAQEKKPLYDAPDEAPETVRLTGNSYPSSHFLKRFTRLPPFPSQIIGLYEGAYCSNNDLYKPAGCCIMNDSMGSDRASAVTLDSLLVGIVIELDDYITYDPADKLLIYKGKMSDRKKNEFLALVDPSQPQYQDFIRAVNELYELTTTEVYNTSFFRDFCYVCKYYIIEKLESDVAKRDVLLKKLSREYPDLVRGK